MRRLVDEVAWALDPLDRDETSSAFGRPAPPPADADVRRNGLADVSDHTVQMRAYGEAAGSDLGPGGAVRFACSLPLSVAVLVETALFQLRVGNEERWRTFERMIAPALVEWTSAPRHRDPVFERDGWRCSVPGCSSRRNLHDHHLTYRSQGGGNARDNRTTVCAAHHLHGIHGGTIRAHGIAPSEITWELGCAGERPPLMRLVGDRYA